MPIRWSAVSWRPTIKLASGSPQPERPDALRVVRMAAIFEGRDVQDATAWI